MHCTDEKPTARFGSAAICTLEWLWAYTVSKEAALQSLQVFELGNWHAEVDRRLHVTLPLRRLRKEAA